MLLTCAYAGYFNGAMALPQLLIIPANNPANGIFPASVPLFVLSSTGVCSQWATFAGLVINVTVLDINQDGNMDILLAGAMQSVIGSSTGSAFNMLVGGSSGAGGSFNPAPYVDHQVNGVEVCMWRSPSGIAQGMPNCQSESLSTSESVR